MSLKGRFIGVNEDVEMTWLLTYIADLSRGWLVVWFVRVVGSISVHEWCIGDDFVYSDQYCSCTSNAVNFIESG